MNMNLYFILVGIFALFMEILFDNIGFRLVIAFVLGFALAVEWYK